MSGECKGRVASLLSLALYMASSSSLIILNKQLMVDDGFRFPLFLTAAGQVASVLLGDACSFERSQLPKFKLILCHLMKQV